MSTPYVGEIRLFGFQRTPAGWYPCDGRLLSISQESVLYTLLGTTYGGDGVSTFALPDLRGRIPMHWGTLPGGSNYVLGQSAGQEAVTLSVAQMPMHTHSLMASSTAATSATPGPSLVPATIASPDTLYMTATPDIAMTPSVGAMGNGVAHENRMPILAMNFCIAANGVFPSRN